MAATSKKPKQRQRPGATIQQREDQLVKLANDLAEKQLSRGSASSQVITHFLKLGTVRAQLEKEKLRKENLLLAARTQALEKSEEMEALYKKAIAAFSSYHGQEPEGDPQDE